MDRPGGIRQNLWIGSALVLGGCILRLLATDATPRSIALLHVSFVLTALAGPIAMSAVSKFSELWFRPENRAFATATAQMSNGLGTGLASLVGPQMVVAGTWASLQSYNWAMLALVGFNAVCMVAYFPASPPTPPSRSAIHSRAQGAAMSMRGLGQLTRQLARNRNFIVLLLAYGLGGGMQAGWSGLLVLNLSNVGVDQTTAGWMAFSSSMVGNLLSVLLGRVADRTRAFKRIIVGGAVINALATAYITLGLEALLPPGMQALPTFVPVMYCMFALGYGAVATFPVIFELAIECTYPLPEASVITFMTFSYNLFAAVMLGIPLSSGGAVFNWVYLTSQVGIALLVSVGLQERFKRYDIDMAVVGAGAEGEGAEGEGGLRKGSGGEELLSGGAVT